MRDQLFMKLPGLLLHVALLVCALGLLAGCVAPYAYVQPDVTDSGSYYTAAGSYSSAGYYASDEPYTGAGYYDGYGTGPYYPGTSGWSYYNGSFPYGGGVGYFGGYGIWPVFFNIGFSSVRDFPGYWGPWYTTILPFRSDCRHWRHCNEHHHHAMHWHDHRRSADAASSRPWLHHDRARVAPLADASRVYRPGADLANRRLGRADAFARIRFVHAPVSHTIPPSFRRGLARSTYNSQPADAAWLNARTRFVHAPSGRAIPPHFRGERMRPMDHQQSFNALWADRIPMRLSRQSTSRDFRPMPRAAYVPTGRARSRVSAPVIAPRSRNHSHAKIP